MRGQQNDLVKAFFWKKCNINLYSNVITRLITPWNGFLRITAHLLKVCFGCFSFSLCNTLPIYVLSNPPVSYVMLSRVTHNLFHTNKLTGSLAFWFNPGKNLIRIVCWLTQTIISLFQGVPWKHYTVDMTCLEKAVLFWTFTMSHLDSIYAFLFEKYRKWFRQVFFIY